MLEEVSHVLLNVELLLLKFEKLMTTMELP